MRLITMIPAAGRSQRFADAGIYVPKPLLPVKGSTMIQKVAEQAPRDSDLMIGVQADISREIKRLFPQDTITEFFRTTQGQAHTVEIMAMAADPHDELLVINCDQVTEFPMDEFIETCRRDKAHAGVLTMPGHKNPAYSYVAGFPWVQVAVEKNPISEHAVAGFYWFSEAWRLLDAIDRWRDLHEGHEMFLTPVLNHFQGGSVRVVPGAERGFVTWGTPDDYGRNC